MKERILITGGCGYIGDAVVQYILENGDEPVVLDNLMYGGSYMRPVQFIGGDITDYKLIHKIMRKHGGFDSVVHLAAIVGDGACAAMRERTIEVNQKATEVLVTECDDTNTRLIFASTCSVYGANNDLLNEESPTNPLSLYAGTKLEAEKFIEDCLDDYIIFRLGTLYGLSAEHARIRSDLVANILTYKATRGEVLHIHGGEQWRPLLHVKAAALAFWKAATLKTKETGTFILSEENYKIIDLAETIIKAVGKGNIESTPRKFEDLRNYKVDTTKADNARLSCSHYGLEHGIKEMSKALRDGRIADVWSPEFHNAKYIARNN